MSHVSKRSLDASSFPGKASEPLAESLPGSAATLPEGHTSQCLLPSHCYEKLINSMATLQNSLSAHAF